MSEHIYHARLVEFRFATEVFVRSAAALGEAARAFDPDGTRSDALADSVASECRRMLLDAILANPGLAALVAVKEEA